MDLGCLDLGCISLLDKQNTDTNLDSHKKGSDANENVTSSTKTGKSKSPKGSGLPTLNALNKFTSQIKKPPHRKNSPINWFPRKKVESYLKRKIKMLQEIDGMNLTLDETLGDSNPHYSRVLREKMAAREAAHSAMEARKAALVEASWCKILRAARIPSKEAEAILLKAERAAAEAFEAAIALGVIMYDTPNCALKPGKIETSMVDGERSTTTTHTVRASFETAFDVDKEMAAAVKTAFIRLSSCPSFDKDEFKELLCKISQNPDMGDRDHQEASEISSKYESESGSELETTMSQNDGFSTEEVDCKLPTMDARQKKYKRRQSLEKLNMEKLVEMMLDRLRCLKEDELSSLATIVATCGLNAALAEEESTKMHDPGTAADYSSSSNIPCRMSSVPRRMSYMGTESTRYSNLEQMKRKQVEPELPSLDKSLVKHITKLEKEVQEARNSKRNSDAIEGSLENANKIDKHEYVPDLGSILVKHTSKLEKEIEEEKKKNSGFKDFEIAHKKAASNLTSSEAVPDLGSILIKHTSKLQKEVQQIRKNTEKELLENKEPEKESNRTINRRKQDVSEVPSLDKFLVKHVSKLEKEVQEAKNNRKYGLVSEKENVDMNKHQDQLGGESAADHEEGLDKVLVKHVSRLEKEKMEFKLKEEKEMKLKTGNRNVCKQMNEEGSLDQILGNKHKSRLEREKMAASQEPRDQIRLSTSRREASERELQEAWGGLSLGNSIKPHLSKLEKDKAAWIKAEEEERRRATDIASED